MPVLALLAEMQVSVPSCPAPTLPAYIGLSDCSRAVFLLFAFFFFVKEGKENCQVEHLGLSFKTDNHLQIRSIA